MNDEMVLKFGPLKIDITSHMPRKNENVVKLTTAEFALLITEPGIGYRFGE